MSGQGWDPREVIAADVRSDAVSAADNLLAAPSAAGFAARADCCSAAPCMRAVFRAAGVDSAPAVLLFCGHHGRVSWPALREAGAHVYDALGSLIASPRWGTSDGSGFLAFVTDK